MSGNIEKMVQYAVGIANDDSHGYSQASRWPSQGSDFDCSSLVYWCANKAGYAVPLSGYTGTMVDDFTAAGFKKMRFSRYEALRGDVLLSHNDSRQHTEIYLGNGQSVGAHIAETGGVTGKPGDQTGNEISVQSLWWTPDWILRPPADGSAPSSSGASTPKAKGPPSPQYRVFARGKWGAWKSDGACAGTSGTAIYDFEAKGLGPKGWFQLTLEGGKVLGRNVRNTAHAKRVIGITVYYDTDRSKYGKWYEALYRVQTASGAWLKWEHDDNDGGAGDDVNAVCRVRLKLGEC